MLDDVLSASTHPPHPEGDVGLPGASLPWMMHVLVASTSSLMSPMEQNRGLLLYCMLSRCPLCSEHVTAAIPPSPVPMAPSLLSCKALIDAAAPSPGSTDKHLYPPPAVPTPQARRAAGKRLHPGANTAPTQLMLVDFGAVWCQSLLQLIFPFPGSLLSLLGHILGRIHRSQKCPTEHLELRLGCISKHLLQVPGYCCGCSLHI